MEYTRLMYPFERYGITCTGVVFDFAANCVISWTKGPNTLYWGVSLKDPIKNRFVTVHIHRLLAMTFIPIPTGINGKPEVNHMDGNKLNNNLSNLEWVSRGGNLKHAYDHKLRSKNTPVFVSYFEEDEETLTAVQMPSLHAAANLLNIDAPSLYSRLSNNPPARLEYRGALVCYPGQQYW